MRKIPLTYQKKLEFRNFSGCNTEVFWILWPEGCGNGGRIGVCWPPAWGSGGGMGSCYITLVCSIAGDWVRREMVYASDSSVLKLFSPFRHALSLVWTQNLIHLGCVHTKHRAGRNGQKFWTVISDRKSVHTERRHGILLKILQWAQFISSHMITHHYH